MIIRCLHEITILEALFLGLVQGFTEWLPISSSGHLVIFQALLNVSVPSEFDIVIMAGTIAALILYFRKKILSLFTGLLAGERHAPINYIILICTDRNSYGHYRFCRKTIFQIPVRPAR